ncbi:MAG: type II secretion system protein [Firmicutes bacterium]|nr:type II secretion system protein [Bacillota bacterium]
MKGVNNKGFTLIELLAAMVILGIILGIAVPRVLDALRDSRNREYVEDAKKLISLAEYKYRSDQNLYQVQDNESIIIRLDYFDNSEFDNAPNNKPYNKEKSYVRIIKLGTDYHYDVILLDSDGKGVVGKGRDQLFNLTPKQLVSANNNFDQPVHSSGIWVLTYKTHESFAAKEYYTKDGRVSY